MMPLRALPTPYRIGTDICSISRVKRLLLTARPAYSDTQSDLIEHATAKRSDVPVRKTRGFRPLARLDDRTNDYLNEMNRHLNPQFLAKLFRVEEIEIMHKLHKKVAGSPLSHKRLYETVAGRWAAKEAIIKATSPRSFRDRLQFKPGFHDILIWPSAERRGFVHAAVLSRTTTGDNHPPVKFNAIEKGTFTARDETYEDNGFTSSPTSDRFYQEASLPDYAKKLDGCLRDSTYQSAVEEGHAPEGLDGDLVELSISHERDYAIATALFCSFP